MLFIPDFRIVNLKEYNDAFPSGNEQRELFIQELDNAIENNGLIEIQTQMRKAYKQMQKSEAKVKVKKGKSSVLNTVKSLNSRKSNNDKTFNDRTALSRFIHDNSGYQYLDMLDHLSEEMLELYADFTDEMFVQILNAPRSFIEDRNNDIEWNDIDIEMALNGGSFFDLLQNLTSHNLSLKSEDDDLKRLKIDLINMFPQLKIGEEGDYNNRLHEALKHYVKTNHIYRREMMGNPLHLLCSRDNKALFTLKYMDLHLQDNCLTIESQVTKRITGFKSRLDKRSEDYEKNNPCKGNLVDVDPNELMKIYDDLRKFENK